MSTETLRRVVILRNAKADWTDAEDHERPLAERGRKDAPVAGRWLADSAITPDLAMCSTAVRCRETWKLAAPELSKKAKTVYDDRLYEASLGELIAVLNEVSDEVRDVLIIGHNPGMHSLADALAGEAEADLLPRMNRSGFPTAAIGVLTFNGSWNTVEHGVGRLVSFWAPQA
ncbi:SixA phosphatase family protein [Streptomyces sp. WAC 04229]|uniref:SixA phosphatase family protein n=1 Tax=Streptomyces sp. WAC 04229 TaxID=2203206 RepID=UPI003D71DA1B